MGAWPAYPPVQFWPGLYPFFLMEQVAHAQPVPTRMEGHGMEGRWAMANDEKDATNKDFPRPKVKVVATPKLDMQVKDQMKRKGKTPPGCVGTPYLFMGRHTQQGGKGVERARTSSYLSRGH